MLLARAGGGMGVGPTGRALLLATWIWIPVSLVLAVSLDVRN